MKENIIPGADIAKRIFENRSGVSEYDRRVLSGVLFSSKDALQEKEMLLDLGLQPTRQQEQINNNKRILGLIVEK